MGEKSSIIEMLPHLVIVKGHDYEKTNSAEKVPQTLHNNEFIDFFSYLQYCSIFGRKCQLIKSDVGFYE